MVFLFTTTGRTKIVLSASSLVIWFSPLNQITKDEAESTIFVRPVVVNKKTMQTKMVPCSDHYTKQALRTLKRMQSKALEWKVLRAVPKITLVEAEGRDRIISEQTEEQIE